ncbi:MAG: hypothetical protein RLZZ174_281 [Pseudomonadota bacterium]|jgi:drug/metabolite transporter (DMT)-like permease|nr:DMT family transporter [Pseudomonadales bacterium]MDA0955608.1 DMT family transporter [Pseudomonadota bacterium]
MRTLSLSPALQGMAWMLLGSLAGTLIDSGVKALSSTYDTPQIVLGRLLCGLPFVLLIAAWRGDLKNLRPKRWRGHALRAVLSSGATFGFFFALGELPLTLLVALSFTAPLLIAVLAWPLLGEALGWRRGLAVALGFAGVWVLVNPGNAPWHPAYLAVAGSVLCWAGLSLSARRMANEPAGAMVLSTMPLSLVLAGSLSVDGWTPLEGWSIALFLGIGAAGATLHFSVIMAYRLAQAATVAPMEYAAVLWATLFGALFFDEVPTGALALGAALIIGAGLIILRARE